MSLPQIETILTLPSYSATENRLFPIMCVGVQLTTGQVYWGDCRLTGEMNGQRQAQNIIDQLVAPQLIGQEISGFHALCHILDETMEPYQYEEIVPETELPPVTNKNRRKFWQQISQQKVTKPTRMVQAERPLPSTLRFGLSQAIFQACIDLNQDFQPTQENNTSLIVQAEDVSHTPLFPKIGGVRYKIQTGNPKKHLGPQGEKLQGYLRQLGQWLSRMATAGNYDHKPVIYLDASAVVGQLYENNLGRLLGMIYGLEEATKPYQLYVIDPLSYEAGDKLQKETKELINYLAFRKLNAKVGVSQPIRSLADVEMWLNNNGTQHLCLRPHQLGSLGQLWQAAEKCHKAGVTFTLLCHPRETILTLQILTAVSQHIGPTFFHIPPSTNTFLQVDRWRNQQ